MILLWWANAGSIQTAGQVAAQLGAAVVAATASLPIQGSTAATLDSASGSAQAALPIAAQVSASLSGAMAAASGALAQTGVLSVQLDGASLAASAGTTNTGAVQAALGGVSVSAQGALGIRADHSATLAGAQTAATGALQQTGALAGQLDGAVLAAQAGAGNTGAAQATLQGASLAAQGALGIQAQQVATLEGAQVAATGALPIAAQAAPSLASAQAAAAGSASITATVSSSLQPAGIQAQAVLGPAPLAPITATVNVTTDSVSSFSAATQRFDAVATPQTHQVVVPAGTTFAYCGRLAPASITLTGPSTLTVGQAGQYQAQFVGATAGAALLDWTGGAEVFAPPSLTVPAGTSQASFTMTPSAAGAGVLTVSQGATLSNAVSVTATAVAPPPPVPPPSTGAHLHQQPLLFQRMNVDQRIAGYTYNGTFVPVMTVKYDGSGAGHSSAYRVGSNNTYLCAVTLRRWQTTGPQGGDWVDSANVYRGAAFFAESPPYTNGLGAGRLTINVTSAVQWCFSNQHWLAFFLRPSAPQVLRIRGPLSASAKSTLVITYTDSTSETLQLWYRAGLNNANTGLDAQKEWPVSDAQNLLMEFYREADPHTRVAASGKTVASALMHIEHDGCVFSSSTNVKLRVFVVKPNVPADMTPVPGIAAAYPLDAGIFSREDVAVALNIMPGMTNADVLDESKLGFDGHTWIPGGQKMPHHGNESVWDPNLWGTPGVGDFATVADPSPAVKATLLPHRVIAATHTKLGGNALTRAGQADATVDQFRVIGPTDALAISRGFHPLHPNLGAMESVYGGGTVPAGGQGNRSVTGAGWFDLFAQFKPQHQGRLVHTFTRFYVLLPEASWGPDANDEIVQWQNGEGNDAPLILGSFREARGLMGSSVQWVLSDKTGKFLGDVQQVTSNDGFPLRRADTGAILPVPGGGGYSVTSGPAGRQDRNKFQQGLSVPGLAGPAVGGVHWGIEKYDFGGPKAIPSQTDIADWDADGQSGSTQSNGLGWLRTGYWYCLEVETYLNTVKPASPPPAWPEGGHNVDGYHRFRVNGVVAATTPLFATRSSAYLFDWATQNSQGLPWGTSGQKRPISNVAAAEFMGQSEFVAQLYYGGSGFNPKNRFVYWTGLVVSDSQLVGPMAGVSLANGGLGV